MRFFIATIKVSLYVKSLWLKIARVLNSNHLNSGPLIINIVRLIIRDNVYELE